MQICKKLTSMFGSFLHFKYIIVAASLSVIPMTASAKTVEIWQLDNFFSNVTDGAPTGSDNVVTSTTIEPGDTVEWVNRGSTDHTTTNDNVLDENIFEGALWDSNEMSVGESFTHTFNDDGEFPYFCKIHGREDMAGKIIVGKDEEPPPDGGKSFTFNCSRSFKRGPAGLETMILDLGDTESCTLKLTRLEPGTFIEVSTILRTGFRSSINVTPASGMTNENGEFEVTITAEQEGIDWVAWGVPNERGEISFNKKAYDSGKSWGMFVEVKK